MRKTFHILMMALAICFAAELVIPVGALAATPKTEKQKAAEKKQKEAEKAKAAKAKEKAKQQAQKEKAKQQAQKEKDKSKQQAQKEKAKQQAQKEKSKQQAKTAAPKKTTVDNTAAYEQRVREIEAANAKAIAYNNRDIDHRLGAWGQVGYSSLLTSGLEAATATNGFDLNAKGGVGGGIGLGYQMRYQQFLLTTGVEMQFYNSKNTLTAEGNDFITRTYPVEQYPTMAYTYRFDGVRDQWLAGYVQLPVMAGMELRNVPLFWQAGVKVGLGVLGQSTTSASLTTMVLDQEFIDIVPDMPSHDLVTSMEVRSAGQKPKWGMNLAAAAELGVNLDQWISAVRMRVSAFAEYGVLNTYSKDNNITEGAEDLPMTKLAGVVDTKTVGDRMRSALNTTTVSNLKTNPLFVGVKLAVFFDLPRKQKPVLPLPKEPTPRMAVLAYHAETNVPVPGAMFTMENTADGKTTQKATNTRGQAQLRLAKGDYRVSASKLGFYPSDTVFYTLQRDLKDTLRIALRPEPIPVVYTLAARVSDRENGNYLPARVRISSLNENNSLYVGETDEDGLFITDLRAGTYVAHLSATGYLDCTDTLHFVQDTLSLYMDMIKKGTTIKVENLFFATNQTTILPQSEEALAELAQFLLDNPEVRIHVVGHTDNVGSEKANQKLSEGRANSLRNDLIIRGVKGDRVTTEGKGETMPVADNDTEEGRALNRRVEFTIL